VPVHNATVTAIFDEIADLLDIQGANPFRIRAYRNAARTIGELGTDIKTFIERGNDLKDIPGIGEDLASKIREIVQTGRCAALERLRSQVPPAVAELLRLPGLGPKRVRILWHELDVQTLEQVERAARDHRIRSLHGFGDRMEERILHAAQARLGQSKRFKLSVASQYADALVGYLRRAEGVIAVEAAGSLRRMRETVGDIDLLVAAKEDSPVMGRFTSYEEVKEILASGPTRGSVVLKNGLQADIRVIPHESYGAAMQYFTGSKAHNIALRRIAQEKGLKLNEYGVFLGKRAIAGETEASVYAALGLPWIPPELREDRGEIEAARAGRLPKLVALEDLRGDLHCHSKASDGHHSIEEMAQAAKARGLTYIAITEHSRRLTVARGLDSVRLIKQIDEIDQLNKQLAGIVLLKGMEVDILEDGTLDLPDSVLTRLDVVVAAVHSKFGLTRAMQTQRILRAIRNPLVSILAHPSGRLIDEREPYDVDMAGIIREAKTRKVALEVNAHPQRLDLLDTYCQMAKDEGVLLAINSDAHSIYEFDMLRYGVGQARRGWIEKQDVLNCMEIGALRGWLKQRNASSRDQLRV